MGKNSSLPLFLAKCALANEEGEGRGREKRGQGLAGPPLSFPRTHSKRCLCCFVEGGEFSPEKKEEEQRKGRRRQDKSAFHF